MATLEGVAALNAALAEIGKRMASAHVNVGFMSEATYPDGTPVAAVGFWNEYGDPGHGRPPRPFFRQMIAKESPGWGAKLAKAIKFADFDAEKALGLMGEDIKGALAQSITDFTSPGLAESTIERKGFEKPLIDTGHMLNSITYAVES